MKKCIATVVYKDTTLKSIIVNHNGNLIKLSVTDTPYATFNVMYKAILSILKANSYYVSCFDDFHAKFYNIQFIDMNKPTDINKYGYYEI